MQRTVSQAYMTILQHITRFLESILAVPHLENLMRDKVPGLLKEGFRHRQNSENARNRRASFYLSSQLVTLLHGLLDPAAFGRNLSL